MKLILKILIILALPIFCSAQPEPYNKEKVDSITRLLPFLKNDSTKVNCLEALSGMFTAIDSKIGLKYAQEAIEIARKINYTDGLIAALGRSAFINAVSTEWPRSINELKEIMQYLDPEDGRMMLVYNVMFINYATKEEPEQSLVWGRKALNHPLFSKLNDLNRWATYMQMGIAFQSLNQFDSVKKYSLLLKDILDKYATVSPDLASNSYTLFAMIAQHEERYEDALKYYRLATNYNGIAEVYDKKGYRDSVIYYAKLGLAKAQSQNSEGEIQRAAILLARQFEISSPIESNKYLKIYISSKDKKLNIDKLKQFEQIRLDEQRSDYELEKKLTKQKNSIFFAALAAVLAITFAFILLLYRNIRQKQKSNQALAKTLSDLRSTQAQLVQSEKMASLGELTAGIAHEIQNPLNFVNNFSEVNKELAEELESELKSGNSGPAIDIARDIRENSEKINHHGKRAEAIVKGMLQHSRSSSGQKEPTDINALCDEYLRLAYHGFRAKDKSFNASFETRFEPGLSPIPALPQDLGRVVLNLITNAFYSVNEKARQSPPGYQPQVVVSTRKINRTGKEAIEIRVSDNGTGIPEKIRNKIFQPFFTTKPTGQGTGLGLSLAFDIITKGHGGELTVESKVDEGNPGQSGKDEGSSFVITLPIDPKNSH